MVGCGTTTFPLDREIFVSFLRAHHAPVHKTVYSSIPILFPGVTLDSGKRYTQTVEKSFHLSMAALGFQNCSSVPVTIMVEVDKAQFALCTLQPGKIPQQPLDYCFTEGEEITFFTEGPGDVHLTGLFYFEFLFLITIILA